MPGGRRSSWPQSSFRTPSPKRLRVLACWGKFLLKVIGSNVRNYSNWYVIQIPIFLKCLIKIIFNLQINDWFDCLNVRSPFRDSRERVHGFGLSEPIQNDILEKMPSMMLNMRVQGKNTLLPFQKGKKTQLFIVNNR